MEYYEFRAMNTDIVLAAEGAPQSVQVGFAQARAYIEASEARFTRFAGTSELSALNRASGEWTGVSTEMFQLMQEAYEYVDATEGLFDPSILDALERAGYDKSMDEIRRFGAGPQATRPAVNVSRANIHAIEFDRLRRAIRLPRGLRIDLGGIAKGWIAERAARKLAQYAAACTVSAGGDMFMLGLPMGAASWEVALEDPRDTDNTLAILNVNEGALATSSIVRRRWQQGTRTMHHLIDPRTGQPADTDWLSVSVVAPHAATAEVFAKVLLIAGSRDADRISARRSDIAYLAVDAEGQLHGSIQVQEAIS